MVVCGDGGDGPGVLRETLAGVDATGLRVFDHMLNCSPSPGTFRVTTEKREGASLLCSGASGDSCAVEVAWGRVLPGLWVLMGKPASSSSSGEVSLGVEVDPSSRSAARGPAVGAPVKADVGSAPASPRGTAAVGPAVCRAPLTFLSGVSVELTAVSWTVLPTDDTAPVGCASCVVVVVGAVAVMTILVVLEVEVVVVVVVALVVVALVVVALVVVAMVVVAMVLVALVVVALVVVAMVLVALVVVALVLAVVVVVVVALMVLEAEVAPIRSSYSELPLPS